MSAETLNLVISNNKKIDMQTSVGKAKESFTLPQINSNQNNESALAVAQRVRKLQSNLRMLEKQYRVNLKEGFDNKIKAYRLEAVVQRKMLKEAIYSVSKRKQYDTIQSKKRNTQSNTLQNSRVQLMKIQRQNREKVFKKKLLEDKKSFSLCLNEARLQSEQKAKESHDKIVKQNENINRKRDYFSFIRKQSFKKEEEGMKQSLLQKITTNTQKLKELKTVLQSLKGNEITVQKTFLTI